MLYIGVDLGTSAVKLLLMDEKGTVRRVVSKEYPLFFPQPGWSEQRPEDWYEQTMAGLKELLKDCDRSKVEGISFGGQMHGLVILDEEDRVIRPAILWNDGRTGEETDYLNQVIGKEKLSEYTGNIAFAGFTAPKLLWVKKHEPEHFAAISKIMLPKDYLAYRLSGVHCTDVSDASGMLLFDVKNRCWSKEMCEICGVSLEQLAKVYESYEVVGTLLPQVAPPVFWGAFHALLAFHAKAFLGTMLKSARVRRQTVGFTLRDGGFLLVADFLNRQGTALDRGKFIVAMLRMFGEDVAELEHLFQCLHVEDGQGRMDYLLQGDGMACAYLLFRAMRHAEHDHELLARCCRLLMKKGDRLSFNLASLAKVYFDLPQVKGTFSLRVSPYQLGRLESSYADFKKMMSLV